MINDITCTSNNTIELSRGQLISWVNCVLKTNIGKIEQLGSGVAYCQLLDVLYPGKVPLGKVNSKAKFDYEFVSNFKILQQSFIKLNILKHIDVQKLVKCKYQDNLEFLQWFKKIFDTTNPKENQSRRSDERKQSGHYNSVESYDQSDANSLNENNQKNYYKPQWTDRTIPEQILIQPEGDLTTQITKLAFMEDKEMYLRKFKEIQHLMETWDTKKNSQQLINNIRSIIMVPPQTSWKIDQGLFVNTQ